MQQEVAMDQHEQELLNAIRQMVDETDSLFELSKNIVQKVVVPGTDLSQQYHSLPDTDDLSRIDKIVNAAIALEDWYGADDEARLKMPSKAHLAHTLFDAIDIKQ